MTSITAVILCYDEEPGQTGAAVDSLLAQTRLPSEILIMDNGPAGRLAIATRGYAPAVRPIECRANLSYIALNTTASQASGDYLVCLNPDAKAQDDCLERLAAVADSDPQVGIVGAQILLEDGRTRNAGANPLHPTGISPSGGYGEPREHDQPRDVIVASGACFLARRDAFLALGGWLPQKLRAYGSLFALRKRLMLQRRAVQASRRCSDAELLRFFDDRLDSALIPHAGAALANLFCVPYVFLLRRVLA
jgi:GT2 family glycosyltransferase